MYSVMRDVMRRYAHLQCACRVGVNAHSNEPLREGHPLVVVGGVIDLLVDVLDDLRCVCGVHDAVVLCSVVWLLCCVVVLLLLRLELCVCAVLRPGKSVGKSVW